MSDESLQPQSKADEPVTNQDVDEISDEELEQVDGGLISNRGGAVPYKFFKDATFSEASISLDGYFKYKK